MSPMYYQCNTPKPFVVIVDPLVDGMSLRIGVNVVISMGQVMGPFSWLPLKIFQNSRGRIVRHTSGMRHDPLYIMMPSRDTAGDDPGRCG